jgi:hypothetical protein
MPGDNGQPAMRSAGPDEERVSTAALLAAMELIRGMSDNPAATPPDQLMDDIQRAQIRPEADRRAPGHPPGCSPACVPTSTPSWSSWTVRTTTSMLCSVALAPIVRLARRRRIISLLEVPQASGVTWTVHGSALPTRFNGGFAIARRGVGLLALHRLRLQAATLPA